MLNLTKRAELVIRVMELQLPPSDATALLAWLGIGSAKGDNPWVPRHVNEMLLDYCINCDASYGKTYGGRLRYGCPNCRGSRTGQKLELTTWIHHTGLPDTEFLRYLEMVRGVTNLTEV